MTLAKPDWLRVRLPSHEKFYRLRDMFNELQLHTVCQEANCPNIAECWAGGTATIMIMGDSCTRACRFCNVQTSNPRKMLDPLEPLKVAEALGKMHLDYVVITSVDRDDLPDGGSSHFAATIRAIKEKNPDLILEVLIPDFLGNPKEIKNVVDAGPEVVAHNIETTEKLTQVVRDQRAGYRQSLNVLRTIKEINSTTCTKSSIMLGLGETDMDIFRTLEDLRTANVDFLTIGQYLKPGRSPRFLDVREYVSPEKYDYWREVGESMGFLYVASGPLVRSSYRAGEYYLANVIRKRALKEMG